MNFKIRNLNAIAFKIFFKKTMKFCFEKHILATNIISSGLLMGIGDILQQQIEYRRNLRSERVDYARLGRMFTVGLIEGPVHHYYYGTLDKLLPGMDLITVLKKIFLDQTVASPLFISIFFYGMGTLEGKTLPQCTTEIRNNIVTVYMADCMVWPPTQFINFYFIPGPYRVVYINIITMLYNVFLSYMKHKDSIGIKKTDYIDKLKEIEDETATSTIQPIDDDHREKKVK